MEYKEIKKIINDMENSKFDSLSIEFTDGTKISMTKNCKNKEVIEQQTSNTIETSSAIEGSSNGKKNIENKNENYKIVTSPMVGTFYQSSSPDAKPFVQLGDKVKKGQILCIVEAMKLMNEIESEYDGEIVEICVKNDEFVEYGTPLFKIK